MYGDDWGYGELSSGAAAFIVVMVLVGLAIGILIQFLFLRNLRDLLRQVSNQNRAMEPNHVFLNFIPLFGTVWLFITVIRVRDSVQAEFRSRNWPARDDFGYSVGMAYAVVGAVSIFLSWIPVFGGLIALGGFVCWIVYWVRTSGVKKQLREAPSPVGYAPAPPQPGQWGAPVYGAYPGYGSPVATGPRRTCSSCGVAGEPGDEFCRKCGSRVDAPVAAPTGAWLGAAQSADVPSAPAPFSAPVDASTPVDGSAPGDAAGAATSTCPFCGAAYRANAQFCASCGRPVI